MKACVIAAFLMADVVLAHAADPSSNAKLSVGGYVDVYYAFAFTRPPSRDRSFTTQPFRHNEFNINVALIDVKYTADNVRGRFALHTGTYAQSNYAVEPPLLQNIHEASAGFRPGKSWWVDMGIFPAHIGFESAISKDNWTYSRSLMADYSPYYEAGLKLSGPLSEKLTLGVLVMNGWQNIHETNNDKAFGTQLQFKPNDSALLNWSTFVGNEAPDSQASQVRIFNNFYGQTSLRRNVDAAIIFDIGFQKKPSVSQYASWYTGALIGRVTVSPTIRIGGRMEYYADNDQIIIVTGTPDSFQTFGVSVNLDYAVSDNFLFRVEGRLFDSKHKVYPSSTGLRRNDGFLATSFALSLY
ncbi:MAG: porin [Candidatus Latescibacteria bacterium]|nr:porin [Candidatus Latescibacterota bacterium]